MISIAALTVSASTYNPSSDGSAKDIEVPVPQADPAYVVKDGIIDANEYKELQIDTNCDTTDLNMSFGSSAYFEYAEETVKTIKYFFSWDEVHGFNMAVMFKPHEQKQLLSVAPGDIPGDDFLCNVGIQINISTSSGKPFYYAIAKRTDTGEYLKGHYMQFGNLPDYDPVEGTDFIISYNTDGYTVCEWSVPFDVFTTNYSDDTEIGFTLCVTGGDASSTDDSDRFEKAYSVSLGDFGWLCQQNPDGGQATAILEFTDYIVDKTGDAYSGVETVPSADTSDDAAVYNGQSVTEDGEIISAGPDVTVENEATPQVTANSTTAANTADPVIAVAAVCALSSGAVLILRRKY